MKSTKERFDQFDSRFRELAIRESEALFAMYRGLEHEDLDKIEAETSALWREPETRKLAKGKPRSSELRRPVFLLKLGALRNEVEGIEDIYKAKNLCNRMLVEFKPEVDGRPISRSDLGELLKWDKDAARRRRASGAFVPLEKELHEKVLDLIDRRNRAAKDLGFESFPHLAFELNELDLDEVKKQLGDLLEQGADSFEEVLMEQKDQPGMTPGGLLSSDLSFLHENFLPNLPREKFPEERLLGALRKEYLAVGIDLEKLPIQTVIRDIPAGGFCFTFDPGKDVRILANPRDGQSWYQVLFHEYGHAVQGSVSKGDGHYLVALGDPGFFWEAIAVLFEKLAMRKKFLAGYVDDEGEIERFLDGARKRLAFRIRSLAMDALFEYMLYLDPAPYEELQKRRAAMIREYYLVEPAVDPPPFTTNIFHITHPCYIQNYVLAEMAAAHLLEASQGGDPWTPDLAKRIIDELLVPGAMMTWQEKIRRFSGKDLSPEALVRQLYGG